MKTIRLKLLLVAFTFLCISVLNAQYPPQDPFEIVQNQNGVVDYNSNLYSSDLHFYVLGDGFYRRKMHPQNNFISNTSGWDTDLYHVKNKDDVPPTKTTRNTGSTSNGNPGLNPLIPMSPNIDPTISWAFTDYADNFILLNFENKFSSAPSSGCVELNWNSSHLNVLPTETIIFNGWTDSGTPISNGYRWEYVNLDPDEQRVLYVPAISLLPPGKRVTLTASIDDGCDGGAITKTVSKNTRRWPHDPNSLEVVNVEFLSESEALYNAAGTFNQVLVYEVQFHNNGDAPVTTVVVEDVLPGILLGGTAELLSSDHPGSLDVIGNVLTFSFNNINLPGLGQPGVSFDETISKFRFSVCAGDVDPNSCIANDVDIFFDLLPPINADNTTCTAPDNGQFGNRCQSESSPPSFGRSVDDLKVNKIKITPNPVGDHLVWSFDNSVSVTKVQILSNEGKLLLDNKVPGEYNRLFVGDLDSGIYMIRIETTNKTFVERFVKL